MIHILLPRRQRRGDRRRLLAAVLAAGLQATPAGAHDSWFSLSGRGTAPTQLQFGTGNRYPVQEIGPAPVSVRKPQCSDGQAVHPLRPGVAGKTALTLTLRNAGPRPALACWLELAPAEVMIDADRVHVYLDEIRTSTANRGTWARWQARGIAWQETYRKFARIELPAAHNAEPAELAAARRPVGLALELVVLGEQPLRRGQEAVFQLLRDGRPLAGLAVELINERSPLGLWRTTDARGMLRQSLPLEGQWLLRATDLRTAADAPDRWDSRFVTLAIGVR